MLQPKLFDEATVEAAALDYFADLGYTVVSGAHIAPGELAAERSNYTEVVLPQRLRAALARLNPKTPASALEDAFRKVAVPESPSLVANNRSFHRRLVEGIEIEYQRSDGSIAGDRARLVDFEHPDANDWLVVNQFTVV